MSSFPKEIQALLDTLKELRGVLHVDSFIYDLSTINKDDLGLVIYNTLPNCCFHNQDKDLTSETLIQIEFSIDGTHESLLSLNFISWCIRDKSRGGESIQLRSWGIAPQFVGDVLNLKFYIDYFFYDLNYDLQPALLKVQELNQFINLMNTLYN